MAAKQHNARFTVYTGTAAKWAASSVILLKGEIGYESDTGLFKFGDGTSAYSALKYANKFPTKLSELTDDATHRFVTDTEKGTWNGKQDKLTFDDAPAASSNNPVKSSGIFAALGKKANADDISDIGTSGNLSDAIEDETHRTVTDAEKKKWDDGVARKIPTKTSELTNDGNGTSAFATEEYVKQRTTSAYVYKGSVASYDKLPEEGQTAGDTYNVVAAYGSYPAGTNFAWTGTEWDALGGSIDTSVFALKASLKTIATSGKLADAEQDATHRVVTDTEKTTWNGKQDKLTFDSAPKSGSTNPVTSGGIYTALAGKAGTGDIIKSSTGLTDSDDLMRYSDTLVINGGEL